ncbi:hypothetical protein [Arthrobacter sp. GAS37]|uniref:hypothetical protein n=1 Tax=Arthrobacter sp. GAS37 TaxID=3156261 RepID=UPI003851306C
MSTNLDPEGAAEQLPAEIAGKSAGQIEGILELIDSGALEATKAQRAYLAGAAFALRQAQIQG